MAKYTKTIHISVSLIGTLSLLLFFQNCSDVRFAEVQSENRLCTPSGEDDCVLGVPGQPFTKSYTINNQSDKKADILFVVDASGSMNYEQTQIRDRFSGFIDSLLGIDWRVAITTTIMRDFNYADGPYEDQPIPGTAGSLIAFTGAPDGTYFIDSSMNLADRYFRDTIRRPQSCGLTRIDGCDDHERGIYQTNLIIANQMQHGFFRAGSNANIVIVSDENENSNGRGLEELDQPNVLFAAAKSLLPSRSFTVHSIILKPGDENCRDDEGENYGTVYKEVSDLTNGVIGSVCSDDYTKELDLIAENILVTTQSLDLPCTIEGDLTVTSMPMLDGSYSFSLAGTKLNFNKPLPDGVKITVSGMCKGA